MPLEVSFPPAIERATELNRRYAHHAGTEVLAHALTDPEVGHTALVSSFGAESVVLLHMVSVIDRTVPVLFIDTEMLFPETLEYQRELSERLRLSNVKVIQPDRDPVFVADPDSNLHKTDPDACCALRKTAPLLGAIQPYDAWITGRKRYQGGKRLALPFFEADGESRIKVNPLAHWSPEDVQDYIQNNRLPRHPLVAKGYPSIGCLPCTTRVGEDEDERAGRWRGFEKTECGIHFENGRAQPANQGELL